MAVDKYKHPHDVFNTVDNTEVRIENAINNGAVLLSVYTSDKGIDNQLFTHADLKKFLEGQGAPNLRLHGQALHNTVKWLEAGGVVKGMRVTATDATYANFLLLLKLSVREEQKKNSAGAPLYTDATTGLETTVATGNIPVIVKVAYTKLMVEHFTTLSSLDQFTVESMIRTRYDDSNPVEGIVYPLYLFTCRGRGSYGKSYRVRLTPNFNKDKETSFRNYVFELFNNENGLARVEVPLNVSTSPNAKGITRVSEYLEDVIKRNIFPVAVYSIEDYYYQIAAQLQPVLEQTITGVTEDSIDFLYFRDKKGARYQNVVVDVDSVDLSLYEGYPLDKGSDGAFDKTNPNRFDAIFNRIKDAYDGLIDPSINDPRKHPAHIALDANFPLEVKQAMTLWRYGRKDVALHLDAGIMSTLLDLKTWRNSDMVVDDTGTILHSHNFATYDQYSGKDIVVTETYAIAAKLPGHVAMYGWNTPMAGELVDLKDLIIDGSLRPAANTPEDKTALYELRLNYIEEEFDKIIFATQLTSQMRTTDLTDANNVYIYNEIMRDLMKLGPQLRYKPNESDEDFKEFNRMLNARLEKYQPKVKYIAGQLSKSAALDERKKLLTRIFLGFKSFTEINDFTIEINRY